MAVIISLKCTNKTRSIPELATIIKGAMGSEVVCDKKMLNDKALLLCFEEYYFRCKNYVTVTVMITESEDCQEAVVVGSGGGSGLANISLGANSSFARKVAKRLIELEFK